MHTELLLLDHSTIVDLLKEVHVCGAANAARGRQAKVTITKGVKPWIGIMDGVENQVISASFRSRVETCVDLPIVARSLHLV